ncbi:MAG: RdgB/HAM1 family non-canonical purine NTP pyrophosphatase [Williamsia sp.]|nr:RdgB/HAM1 family non-canonical purine NTP pyrophosphatase [Williamsia sp.]
MIELLFATNNAHKVAEVQAAVGDRFRIIPLKEAGIQIDIPEPHLTLEENALEKSMTIFNLTGKSCFSEDTGLEVEVLGGEPGVKSARYAGENRSDSENIQKLLHNLGGQPNRAARFRTIVSLLLDGKPYSFEGICNGTIRQAPAGTQGFGYDPVFQPAGSAKTFAEMTIEEKGQYSHRKMAISKLVAFLQQVNLSLPNDKYKI